VRGVPDKRLAYRIVETALLEALGESSDLGDWKNLPLERLLRNKTHAETFWLSVLIQVGALTKKSFTLFEYIDPDRHRQLENIGSVVADEVERSMLMVAPTLEPTKEVGRYSRERISTIEGILAYADMERQRNAGGLPSQTTLDALLTATAPNAPAPHSEPNSLTRVFQTIRNPGSSSPAPASQPPEDVTKKVRVRDLTKGAGQRRPGSPPMDVTTDKGMRREDYDEPSSELPHPGGRHIDIESTWPGKGERAAEGARSQRERELTKSYGAPSAPAPSSSAPAPPAPSSPAAKGKQGFSLKDVLFGAPLETSPLGTLDATAVSVFYATDRLQLPKLTGGVQYSKQRSLMGSVHYGKCEVSIPASHKVGKLETPSILRLEFRPDPKKHIVLTKTDSLEEEEFFRQVKASVSRSVTKDAFVFIHGYNVSFEDAARRTGQMAYDLDFVGAPVFYSWPSNGKVADYPKDETNITWSTPHFQRFLKLMSERSGADRIHIIAHSMGNRAVCDALKALSYTNAYLTFNHLVLAAPDIDAETFQELAETLQLISGRITLYESSKDKALSASKRIHGNPRAGEPLLVIPGLDTIDASEIDTDFLGHSYFSSNWPLLSDIHAILFDDKPPAGRFGLMPMEHKDGRYYAFRK
jgi:esterase/lipase superfamily enzyme